jgi:uncharacterized protein (TIGR02466 family)
MKEIFKDLYFTTPVFKTSYEEHIKPLNKLCDPHIKEAIKNSKKILKKDFGLTHHSINLNNNENFQFFADVIIEHSNQFIIDSGFDVSNKKIILSELWVQEFSKLGGGHHSTHVHYNQHVSGFYFLKCSELTSFPRFYDPRPGAVMTKLPIKNNEQISSATEIIHYKVKPGDMIIFPGYLAHEFSVDNGIEPFRFIHWNIQYV